MMDKRLVRSRNERMLGGVCGGLAAYIGIDPTLVRLAFVAGTLMFGWGPILYVILWVIVPEGDTTKLKRDEAKSLIDSANETTVESEYATPEPYKVRVQIDGDEE